MTPTPAHNNCQQIWFSTRQQNWQSLALIPADAGIDVLGLAEALVAVGRLHEERPVNVLNATHLSPESVHYSIESIVKRTARGEWVIVAVDPVVEHSGSVAIAQATSAALLVVRLGESCLATAQTTIDLVGRERFLGRVVFDPTVGAQSSTLPIPAVVQTTEGPGVTALLGGRLTRIAPVVFAAVAIAGVLVIGPSGYRQLRSAVGPPAHPATTAAIPETPVAATQGTRATSGSPIADLQVPANSLPIADSYLLLVASFKNEKFAARLSTTLVEQGLPAFIRHQDGWSIVLIGPYLTREEAREVHGQLEPLKFGDAHIVRERAVALAPEPR